MDRQTAREYVSCTCNFRIHFTDNISSDADSDVLADYVLALLRHDGDESTVRQLCDTEIRDFLTGGKLSLCAGLYMQADVRNR